MAVSQFAEMSKDLYMQLRRVEDLVKGDLFKEAVKKLTGVEETCRNLETLIEEDNKIQQRIVDNRRREIKWIEESIEQGTAKLKSKSGAARKRAAKSS
ncbi:MAG: hypothetical protein JXA01_01310 [Dehalococcoidia bacterium]|nr:hypothetical protein [Dehalococcoidia bacterium]